MSDDELGLLCTPLRLRWPEQAPGAVVRVCATCGSQVFVSPPRIADVDSGRVKPRCIDHPLPDDAVTAGVLAPERKLLRGLGHTEAEIDHADLMADQYLERRRMAKPRMPASPTSPPSSGGARHKKPDA